MFFQVVDRRIKDVVDRRVQSSCEVWDASDIVIIDMTSNVADVDSVSSNSMLAFTLSNESWTLHD